MLTRAQKVEEVKNLSEKLAKAKATFLIDYKGMNVEEVTQLRRNLHPIQSEMKVIKNTLARLALEDNEDSQKAFKSSLVDANAFIFSFGEVSEAAKVLSNYGKIVEALEIKCGSLDGQALNKKHIQQLAKLPGKDELRTQLLAVFQAPMTKFVRTLNEVPSSFVRVLANYKDTKKD